MRVKDLLSNESYPSETAVPNYWYFGLAQVYTNLWGAGTQAGSFFLHMSLVREKLGVAANFPIAQPKFIWFPDEEKNFMEAVKEQKI